MTITTPSGLKYRVIEEGKGPKPGANDTVTVHYTGKLDDGRVFDSSVERGEPITGHPGDFIAGWREALTMMPEGSKWALDIPPSLAYGAEGADGVIPPNATLHFEISLLKVVNPERFLSAQKDYLDKNSKAKGVTVTASGLQYRVIRQGSPGGKSLGEDSLVSVDYEGRLVDGTVFDSSFARGEPAEFRANRLIPGWVEALRLMHEGDEWELSIPAELGYGARGAGGVIPPGAALIFRLRLLKVKD